MRRLLAAFAFLCALALPAQAVTCNPPSNWLLQDGPVQTGNIVIFGPGCGQLQDGGGPGVSGPNPSTIDSIPTWANAVGTLLKNNPNALITGGVLQNTVAGGDAIRARSGALNAFTQFSVGRTGSDGAFGVVGTAGNYYATTASGDVVLISNANLWLGNSTNAGIFIAAAGTLNFRQYGAGILHTDSTGTVFADPFSTVCTVATTTTLGCIKGDNATVSIDGAGVLSCVTGTNSALGCLKGDGGTTISITSGSIACVTGTNSALGCLKGDGGNTVTVSSGALAVNQAFAFSWTATHTFTRDGTLANAIQVRSGNAAKRSQLTVGRTADDGLLGAVGAANDFYTNTAAGDVALKAGTNLWLGSNGSPGIFIGPVGTMSFLGYGTGILNTNSVGVVFASTFTSLCTAATTSALGCVKGDNATISIAGDGTISVNQAFAFSWTATHTFTRDGTVANAIQVRSGNATKKAQLTLGRTADDFIIAVAGVAADYNPNTVAGDAVIESVAGNIFLLPDNDLGDKTVYVIAPLIVFPKQNAYFIGNHTTTSSPTTSTNGPYSWNLFETTQTGTITDTGLDSFSLNGNYVAGHRVNCTYGGANYNAVGACILSAINVTSGIAVTSGGDFISGVFSVYANVSIPGGFGIYGADSNMHCGPSCNTTDGFSHEFSLIHVGTLARRGGIRITISGDGVNTNHQGTADGAVWFATATTIAGSWKNVFLAQNSEGLTTSPWATNANIFSIEGDANYQYGDFLHFINATCSNVIVVPNITLACTPNLLITRAGNDAITVRSGAAGSLAQISVGRTQNEVVLAVAGSTNAYVTGTVAGDAVLQAVNTGNLWLDAGVSTKSVNVFGQTNANAAPAGVWSEVIFSDIASGSGVNMSSGATVNITSIVLTPGDWDVWGACSETFNGATTTNYYCGVSLTSATLPNNGSHTGGSLNGWTGSCSCNIHSAAAAIQKNVTTNTTVYLVVFSVFSVATPSSYGFLMARRRY